MTFILVWDRSTLALTLAESANHGGVCIVWKKTQISRHQYKLDAWKQKKKCERLLDAFYSKIGRFWRNKDFELAIFTYRALGRFL